MLSGLFHRILRSKHNTFKPVVLITGCSSGIGRALASIFRRLSSYRVVITAREKSLSNLRLHFAETEDFWVRALDVTSDRQRRELINEINQKWGGVNVLINNAGISYRSVVEHMSESDELLQMETNYLGPMALIRLVLPTMRERGRGKIINISSVSGMLAMPTMASYSASKHALEGASEALWYEMRPLGISVSLIQPGFVNSNSFQNVYYAQNYKENGQTQIYRDYYEHMSPFISRLMRLAPSTPESIARKILRVVRTENVPLYIPATMDARIFYYLRRLLARRIFLHLLSALLPGSRSWGKAYSNRRRVRSLLQLSRAVRRKLREKKGVLKK